MTVFSVQNETGTVAQLTLLPSPSPVLVGPISVGDIGLYEGFFDNQDGFNNHAFQSLTFTVCQVLNAEQFSVTAPNANMADWPANGIITWQTGVNVTEQSHVIEINPANAYENIDEFRSYHESRGNAVPTVTNAAIQAAIVKATDYLDQKYRFGGIKRLQSIGSVLPGQNAYFLEGWLTPYALISSPFLVSSTTTQSTEFPRQGLVDLNGNTVNGVPKALKAACSELAIRVLNGTNLQPDYDPNLVGNGGVASSVTKKVGPLETVISYDTKMGLGFFASFPQVDRMLSKAGLLALGGSRTVIR